MKTLKTLTVALFATCLATMPAHAKPKPAIDRSAPVALDGKPLPFPKAVHAGDFVFLSGQLGTQADGTMPVGMEAEARQAMANVEAILKEEGLGWNDVVRCVVMLDDMSQWAAFNAVYVTYFEPGKLPARSALGADGLARGGLVEVECTAYKPRK